MPYKYDRCFLINCKIIIVMMVFFALFGCAREAELDAIVKKSMPVESLVFCYANPDAVVIDSEDITEAYISRYKSYILSESLDWLMRHGVRMNPDNGHRRQLRVVCTFSVDWGLPTTSRHFFDVYNKYIAKLNIKVLDVEKNELLGEIEYAKPKLKKHPRRLVQRMWAEMVTGDKDEKSGINEPYVSPPEVKNLRY